MGGVTGERWRDPDRLAVLSEAKRSALLANPLIGDDDEPVQLVGTIRGRVIGRLDVVAGRIETPDGDIECAWGSAFLVPEEYRSSLIGVSLVLKMQQLFAAVGACGPSQLAYPLYKSLRYLDFPLRRYVLLRQTRPVVERYLGRRPGRRAAAAVADLGLAPYRGLVSAWTSVTTRGLRVERVGGLPAELEPRLRERTAPIAMHRSKAWLDWIVGYTFYAEPRERHRRELYVVRTDSGSPAAYFLVKARHYEHASHHGFPDLYLGSLHDWQVLEPSSVGFSHIVLLAARELGRWGVDAVEICVPHDETSFDPRRYGLVPAGAMHVVVKGAPGTPLARTELHDPALWRVRPGEGDYAFS